MTEPNIVGTGIRYGQYRVNRRMRLYVSYKMRKCKKKTIKKTVNILGNFFGTLKNEWHHRTCGLPRKQGGYVGDEQ